MHFGAFCDAIFFAFFSLSLVDVVIRSRSTFLFLSEWIRTEKEEEKGALKEPMKEISPLSSLLQYHLLSLPIVVGVLAGYFFSGGKGGAAGSKVDSYLLKKEEEDHP